jgi:hypothetical protein
MHLVGELGAQRHFIAAQGLAETGRHQAVKAGLLQQIDHREVPLQQRPVMAQQQRRAAAAASSATSQ